MNRMTSGTEDWAYLYTADDERVWSYDLVRNLSHWTVRDLGAKVLRDYLNNAGSWSVATDYIYRDGLLLAAETQTGQRHFHLDHLGTPRLITRAGGEKVAYHVYYPFGEEATAYNQDTERMKFTGHERDLASPGGAGDDLDYMHARHESPVTGRFLSTDGHLGDPRSPQSWNRYTYAFNNPLRLIDHNGKWPTQTHEAIIDRAFPGLTNAQRSVLKAVSKKVDSPSGQMKSHNHDHAMKSPGEDPGAARAAIDKNIKTHEAAARHEQGGTPAHASDIKVGALKEFGEALHTVADRTSPAHTDQSTGAPRDWSGIPVTRSEFQEVSQHESEEDHINVQQMQAAVDAERQAFEDTFGLAALMDATALQPK
jgi:RHS repeat-associated protein